MTDDAKRRAIDTCKPYSKAGVKRLGNLWDACKRIDDNGIAGDLVECGVWRGGCVMLMRLASPHRRVWCFDTFSGMTEPGPHDTKRDRASTIPAGKSACAVHELRDYLCGVGVYDAEKFRFIIGDVRDTLLANDLPDQIAVLRLDTDFYSSTKIELEILYPKLSAGGVLIVDDYGHWLGARKAVDEYFGASKPLMQLQDDYSEHWMVKQ